MPSDLDQLAQDADHQDRWGAPTTSNGLQDLAGQQQMTHQPEQPNPAQPYLDAARSFGQGIQRFSQSGLTGVFPSLRQYMPGFINTLGDLVQSPAARDMFSSANIGGIPFGGMMLRFNSPEALEYYGKTIGMPEDQFASRLWAGMHNPSMSVHHFDDAAGKRLKIGGNIVHNRQRVGDMDRTLTPETGYAYHDNMNIDPFFQGSDYSKRIIASQFGLYPELGINKVGITATNEGASQWPKHGFLPYPQAWPAVKSSIFENFNEMKKLGIRFGDHEVYFIDQALKSRDPEAIWLITDLNRKYKPFNDPNWRPGHPLTSHGRELLSGSFWSGEFNYLNKAQINRANEYLRGFLKEPLK